MRATGITSGKTEATIERLKARIVADEVVLAPLLHPQRPILEGIGAARQPLDRRLAIAERAVPNRQRRRQPVRPSAAGSRPPRPLVPSCQRDTFSVARYSSGSMRRLLNGYGCRLTSSMRKPACRAAARDESPV